MGRPFKTNCFPRVCTKLLLLLLLGCWSPFQLTNSCVLASRTDCTKLVELRGNQRCRLAANSAAASAALICVLALTRGLTGSFSSRAATATALLQVCHRVAKSTSWRATTIHVTLQKWLITRRPRIEEQLPEDLLHDWLIILITCSSTLQTRRPQLAIDWVHKSSFAFLPSLFFSIPYT